MKKFFFPLLALAAICTGCGESKQDDVKLPNISFEKAAYTMQEGPITVKITSGYQGSMVDLPFTVSGDAVADVDYTISANKFVIGGVTPMLEITISPKENFDTEKSLTLTLGTLPTGILPGVNPNTKVTIKPKNQVMVSFLERTTGITASGVIDVSIFDLEGKKLIALEDMIIPVKVDQTANNTAVQGEHFDFDGAAQVVIAKGKSTGTVHLKTLKTEPEKDVFFLTVDWGKGYIAGQTGKIQVTVLGSYGDKIAGEWILYKELTDKAYFDGLYNFNPSNPDVNTAPFTGAHATDKITIDGDSFATEMTSIYKDYFAPKSDLRMGQEYLFKIGVGPKITTQLLILNKINRYFSPTERSDDDIALLAVRVLTITDPESTKEIEVLDVWIIDYLSKAFFQEFVDWGMYDPAKPTASGMGVAINVQYKRVVKE